MSIESRSSPSPQALCLGSMNTAMTTWTPWAWALGPSRRRSGSRLGEAEAASLRRSRVGRAGGTSPRATGWLSAGHFVRAFTFGCALALLLGVSAGAAQTCPPQYDEAKRARLMAAVQSEDPVLWEE